MFEVTPKDEAQQEYESEVLAQAKGTVENDFCDVLAALISEAEAVKRSINPDHKCITPGNKPRAEALSCMSQLLTDINFNYPFEPEDAVAVADAEDRIDEQEFLVDEVRMHWEALIGQHVKRVDRDRKKLQDRMSRVINKCLNRAR